MSPSAQAVAEDCRTRWTSPLVPLVIAACGGIIVDHGAPQPVEAWWLAAVVLLGVWFGLFRFGLVRCSAFILLAAAFCAAGGWQHAHWNLFPNNELGLVVGDTPQPVCVEAVALCSPRRVAAPPTNPLRTIPAGEQSKLTLSVHRVRDGAAWRPASGKAELLVQGQVLGVTAGDKVRAFGFVYGPGIPRNPGDVDFAAYYRIERQLFRITGEHPDAITVVERGQWWNWRRVLAAVRDHGHRLLRRHLHDRQAGLATALLLGIREELDRERTRGFFTSGTIHLLAISGLHVNILAAGFWWVLRCLAVGRRSAIITVAVFAVGYALLTDANPPVVRAVILTSVFCLARLAGRRTAGYNTLAAAGLAVLAVNPASLFQAGTQLSFLAVLTIMALTPWLRRRPPDDPLDRLIAQTRPWPVRGWRRLWAMGRPAIGLTAVVWVVTTPLSAERFHIISPVALLLNPVAAVPVSLALFSGFAVIVLGGWLPSPVGAGCGWVCDRTLAALESVVAWSQSVPGGYFWTPGPAWWWVAGLYGALGLGLACPRWKPPRRWCWTLLAVWLAVGLASTPAALRAWRGEQAGGLTCTFISVGHGASVLVELPDGRTLLYDAGTLGAPEPAVQSISAVLWSRGIMHLDAVVLSHADADHYNALPELLRRFTAGAVYVSPVMFAEEAEPLDVLRQSLVDAGVPLRTVCFRDRLQTPEPVQMAVLHPPPNGGQGGDNANSVVLRITCAGRSILLTGDLGPPGLDDVIAAEPAGCDVLMAPHHGSRGSKPEELLAWAQPRWVVISGGVAENTPAVEELYTVGDARVLHTAEHGAVTFAMGPDGSLEVRTHR